MRGGEETAELTRLLAENAEEGIGVVECWVIDPRLHRSPVGGRPVAQYLIYAKDALNRRLTRVKHGFGRRRLGFEAASPLF